MRNGGSKVCELIINGGRRLCGEIRVQGSKNAVLPILAATLLTDEECLIHNCPNISDTRTALEILRGLGCRAERIGEVAIICAGNADGGSISRELMQKMRSSVVFMGAILARRGETSVYRPGGCRLGERPIDMHISSLGRLGAEIDEEDDCIRCRVGKVCSGDITLLYPSVGATENIMLMCAGGNCSVRIFNPAREPEIVELQNFLNLMGASISGAGSDVINIRPAERLHGCEYTVEADRVAAATYACAAAACGGEVFLRDTYCEHMRTALAALAEAGCRFASDENGVSVMAPHRLRAVHSLKTLPYPGFPTDVQPMLTAALTTADGTSEICETIFENRFSYVPELIKMGADITENGCTVSIHGVEGLTGAAVAAQDLRGGAALVVAGLSANGTTCVRGTEYIDRGYEKIERDLKNIGAEIYRA